MNKLSSVALSAALVIAGVGATASAEAHPYVGRPYYAPYFYSHGRYWHREFERDRYDRFHHERWERR